MLTMSQIIQALNLEQPEDFKQKRDFHQACLLLKIFGNSIKEKRDLNENEKSFLFDLDKNRRSGKTTTCMIQALHAEYEGKDVLIILNDHSICFWWKILYSEYKEILVRHFGKPAGSLSIMSLYDFHNKSTQRIGYHNHLIIKDLF